MAEKLFGKKQEEESAEEATLRDKAEELDLRAAARDAGNTGNPRWFADGETVEIKGNTFRVSRVSDSEIVLKVMRRAE